MPRKPDADLVGQILGAAYQLWSQGGEKALTMRAVARAAGTTTPTVYQRFRDKRAIRELLRAQARENLFAAVKPSRSIKDFCRRYLDFAVRHPNAYQLLRVDWAVRLERDEPKPSFELLKQLLADQLGGSPEGHSRLALALAALSQGTATLLITKEISASVSKELRHVCIAACEALAEDASKRRFRDGRTPGY
jgi:AcrR family transcriptional regulator